MSGGSFNYLCHTDAAEIVTQMGDLRDMAVALTKRGYKDAAAETEAIIAYVEHSIAYVEHSQRQIAARIARLRAVWRAVEWTDSCDTIEESVEKAIAEYRYV